MHMYEFIDNEIDAHTIHELRRFLINPGKILLQIVGYAVFILAVSLMFHLINKLNLMVLGLTYVLLLLCIPFFIRKASINIEKNFLMKFEEIKNHNSLLSSIFFDENGVYVNVTHNLIDYKYFSRIVSTRSTITLFTKAGTFIIVKTDKLDNVSKEEFFVFLKEKCINAILINSTHK